MSHFLVVLAVAIVILIVMIVKFKVHPVLAIFTAGIGAGIAYGYGFVKTASVFTGGFGSTLGGIGATIIFGSIIAVSIQDSGAVKSMVNFFIKLFKGKALELSTGLASFIMSIPIFGDVTQVLMAPLAAIIAKRKKTSMSTMATWTTFAASLTHSMIPPTPGILAVTLLLGANVGFMIFWSIIVSLIAYFGTYILLRKWVNKEWIDPRPDYSAGIEPAKSDDYRELLMEEPGLPSVGISILPILLPVLFIAGSSFINLKDGAGVPYVADGNFLKVFLTAVGERNIAMFIGAALCICFGFSMKDNVIRHFKINSGEDNNNIGDIILNKWVIRALTIALLPLLITAMGGGFSAIIRAYPNISQLGDIVAQYQFPTILVPWIIAAVMMIAVGSRTTAGMTAAAIVAPMADGLGFSPLQLALIIGSGTLVGTHVSDSGFWVGTQLYNLNVKQGLKYLTFIQAVAGIISLIAIFIFIQIGFVK